jgi:hypothetical protein
LVSDWRVLTRRWYVILAGVLVTAGLAFVAASVVPVKHEVMANVLMLPPRTENVNGKVTNPYLDLGGLEGVADVVCKTLSEESVTKSLKAISSTAEYTVVRDASSAAPVILVTVDAATEQEALAIQQALLDRIPQALTAIQKTSSVRSDSLISSSVLTHDTTSTVIQKSRIRALVVVLVGGLGGTLLSAALIDGILRSRRSDRPGVRRGARGGVPGLLDGGPPPAGPIGYPDYDDGRSRPAAYADYPGEAPTVARPQAVGYPGYPGYADESPVRARAAGYAEQPDHVAARPRAVGYPENGDHGAARSRTVGPAPDPGGGAPPPLLAAFYEKNGAGSDETGPAQPRGVAPTDDKTQPRGVNYGALTLRKISKPQQQVREQQVRDTAP